jgi:hypothetical protein
MAHFPFVHTGILGDPAHTEVRDYDVAEADGGLEATQCFFWQPAGLPGQPGAEIEYVYRVKRPLVASLSKKAGSGQGALHIMIAVSPVSATESRAWLVSAHEDDAVHTDQQLYDFNMEILRSTCRSTWRRNCISVATGCRWRIADGCRRRRSAMARRWARRARDCSGAQFIACAWIVEQDQWIRAGATCAAIGT